MDGVWNPRPGFFCSCSLCWFVPFRAFLLRVPGAQLVWGIMLCQYSGKVFDTLVSSIRLAQDSSKFGR